MVSLLVVLGLLACLVAACGPAPTPTPVPTNTPPPTATALPTATTVPTATPLPLAGWVEEGDALLLQSDFAGAEAAYQRAIDFDPKYHPAYVGLSWARIWQMGREEEALAPAEMAVELAPESAAAYAALAQAHLSQLSIGEAVAAAEKAAELDAEDAHIQATLAEVYASDRQYEAALQAAEKAVALDPELAHAYYALSVVYRDTADFARSGAARERAIALEPGFAPWYIALGYLHDVMDEHDQAMAQFQKALELAPDHVAAILGLGSVASDRREYEEAEAHIQRALELIPETPYPYVSQGYLYREQDEPDKALAQFRQSLTKKEDHWAGQFGIADVHLREQECDSAARQAQELMALQPRFADGRVLMGFARLCGGDANKALEYFRKARDLEPQNAGAHAGLGYAYASQGRWEDATSAYVQALRFSPAGAAIHTHLGFQFTVQGDVDSARAEYEAALKLDPDFVEAHIGLGEILLAEGRDSEGQAHAEEALSLEDAHPDARRLLGTALVAQGMPEEAAEVLEDLIEEEPENDLGRFFLGLAYRDLGRYSDARKELETYLALNPLDPAASYVDHLIQALDQGYLITEEKAVSDAQEVLEYFLEQEVDVHVEEVEDKGRTLIISFAADPDQEQQELVLTMSMALGIAAIDVPRIDPAVENGLDVRAEENGKLAYKLEMGLLACKELADGVVPAEKLASKLQFSRTISDAGLASVREITKDLSEIRELEPKADVPHHALTSEGLEKYLTASIDAQSREAMRASDFLLTLLGLIGPDVDLEVLLKDLFVEQTAGFYNPDEQAFYLLEDEEQTALDQMVVAHEFVHALQDQHFGLEELSSESLNADQRRAFDALVEGDAMLGMLLYADEHVAVFDLLQSITGAGGLESSALDASPSFIRGMELFPYEQGLEFVGALYESGGWAMVDEAYDAPPQSTEQVLHPERYREEDVPREVALPDLAAELGGDWQEVENDVLGELGLRLALAEHMAPAAAMLAAEGWAGDRYALLQHGSGGAVVLVMRTYWDDQDEADEFWALYRVCMDHRVGYSEDVRELIGEVHSRWWLSEEGSVFARQEDRYVTIILGPDEETVNQVLAELGGS
jgi:tetratricopeptide (TPR) repeat protein